MDGNPINQLFLEAELFVHCLRSYSGLVGWLMVVCLVSREVRIRGSASKGRFASLMRAAAPRAFRCGLSRRGDGGAGPFLVQGALLGALRGAGRSASARPAHSWTDLTGLAARKIYALGQLQIYGLPLQSRMSKICYLNSSTLMYLTIFMGYGVRIKLTRQKSVMR